MTLLAVILYKEMHITPLQITVITALKPISALLAPYWSYQTHQRQNRLISTLITANILQYTPLLFFPWMQSSWMIIGAFGIYMMLNRGVIPSWMEIFKQNLPPVTREHTFSQGSMVDYAGSFIIPIGLGIFLDTYGLAWIWVFPVFAMLGLCSTFFLARISIKNRGKDLQLEPAALSLQPLKQSWSLIQQRPDFLRFQIGFMLGGGGLMLMQPALPLFFVDSLQLSFTQMGIAIGACKALGFVCTSSLWAKIFRQMDIYRFSSLVIGLAVLFPLLLICAKISLSLLCAAYIIYGIMQAGSELGWHLSGPVFAQEEDSTPFSSTNVLAVGIRGCFFPFAGSSLYYATNATTVLLAGGLLCALASYQLLRYAKVPARI